MLTKRISDRKAHSRTASPATRYSCTRKMEFVKGSCIEKLEATASMQPLPTALVLLLLLISVLLFFFFFNFVICSDSSGKLIIEISLKGRSNDYKATIVWYAGSDTTHAVTQAAMERAHQEALAKQKETLLAEKQEWQKRFTAKVLYFLHMSP